MPRIKICQTEDEIINIPNEIDDDRKPSNYGYYKGKVVCVDYPFYKIEQNFKGDIHGV